MRSVSPIAVFAGALVFACSRGESPLKPSAETGTAAPAVREMIMVDRMGFHPSEIHARAGQKLTLVFHRTTDATCAKQVVFKDLGITKELPLNQQVEVNLTATTAPIGFVCGMGMSHGSIVAQ